MLLDAIQAFRYLLYLFTLAPILLHPDPKKLFVAEVELQILELVLCSPNGDLTEYCTLAAIFCGNSPTLNGDMVLVTTNCKLLSGP